MKFSVLLTFFILAVVSVGAQNKLTKEQKKALRTFDVEKPFVFEVPIWVPGFAGDFAYGDVDLEADDGWDPGDPGDPDDDNNGSILRKLFKNEWYLRFFYLTKISYEKGKFMVFTDAVMGSIGDDVTFVLNNKNIAESRFSTFNMRLAVGYKFFDKKSQNNFRYEIIGFGGVRGHSQLIRSSFVPLDININININPKWIEPLIGAHVEVTKKRWKVLFQADYGGLLKEQKYSSMFVLNGFYKIGRTTSLRMGWTVLSLNHFGSVGNEDYKINVLLTGPGVGLGIHL